MLTGKETVEEAVEECFKNPELEILALKQGSRGSKIYTKEKTVETGIYRIQPVDATGAGDSFDAAFICGLCEGKRIEEAAKWQQQQVRLIQRRLVLWKERSAWKR